MGWKCCMPGCKVNRYNSKKIRIHSFPVRNPNLRLWIELAKTDITDLKKLGFCDVHFSSRQKFTTSKKNRTDLVFDAVPDLELGEENERLQIKDNPTLLNPSTPPFTSTTTSTTLTSSLTHSNPTTFRSIPTPSTLIRTPASPTTFPLTPSSTSSPTTKTLLTQTTSPNSAPLTSVPSTSARTNNDRLFEERRKF